MITYHIAGPNINFEGHQRQRCAWCGVVLADHHLADGESPNPFPTGSIVEMDGEQATAYGGATVPDDTCAQLEARG